jgi:chorismate synthase
MSLGERCPVSEIRLTTAGESHGPYELCILEGIPAGLSISLADVDLDLARRQQGYGRGGRMSIEQDRCEFVAGVRLGLTLGSPIAILVANRDHKNWGTAMRSAAPEPTTLPAPLQSSVPRPGHADFAGMAKFNQGDIRPILERASARETVARVSGGAVCRRLLQELGVTVRGRVVSLGDVASDCSAVDYARPESVDWEAAERSAAGCDDETATVAMCAAVDAARESGESLGGVFEVWAWGVCPGLGSHVTAGGRLDGRLAGAVASIPAIKGVEIGPAFENATLRGSRVHDAFVIDGGGARVGLGRPTNRAGGLEGGMTNGMPVIIRAAMKPIPTLMKPLPSVDLNSMSATPAHVERSDITAVPAARVVGEAVVACVLAGAYVEKFGGDSMSDLVRALAAYSEQLEGRGLWHRS